MLIGVLGGGQLGRMMALAGYPYGLRFRFWDPARDAPAGQIGELISADYDDPEALRRFCEGLSVATLEFENVPLRAFESVSQHTTIHPNAQALATAQERLAEKDFFRAQGIPTPEYLGVDSRADLDRAVREIGVPAVLKTRRGGYDGKGQAVLRAAGDADAAFQRLGGVPLILERFVPFDRELSLIAVRSTTGEVRCYPLVENTHREGILRLSIAPAARVGAELQGLAEGHARRAMEALGYVGVLAIEFFQLGETLMANEMAPRVHNSGHWSIEGAVCSQFENHVRAILGWPLGATTTSRPHAMLNLIGSYPEPARLAALPGWVRPHLYGKSGRPGRKVGHLTLSGEDHRELAARVAEIRTHLSLG